MEKVVTLVMAFVIVVVPVGLILYRHYQENWLQFVGLVGMSMSIVFIFDRISKAAYIPPAMEGLTICIACYLVGTVLKVIKYRPRKKREPEAPPATLRTKP